MSQASTALATRPQLVSATGKPEKLPPPRSVGELLSRDDDTIQKLRAVATRFLPPERALRLAIAAVRRTPKLAQCDPATFMGAMIFATGLGLEPNTPLNHSFLIPYKHRNPQRDENGEIISSNGRWVWEESYECQFQIGYRGFISLAYRSKSVVTIKAEAIRKGDHFVARYGTEDVFEYEKLLDGQRGPILGAFCFTRMQHDGFSATVMTRDDLDKIRARSQTWTSLVVAHDNAKAAFDASPSDKTRKALQKAETTLADTPWEMWDDEMSAKSAIRRHVKSVDLSPDVHVAAEIDTLASAGAIDLRAMADGEHAKTVLSGDEDPPLADDAGDDAGGDDDQAGGQPQQIAHTAEQPIDTVQQDGGAQSRQPEPAQRQATQQQGRQQPVTGNGGSQARRGRLFGKE